jgi:hypothetical protein
MIQLFKILFFFIVDIHCETWFNEVNGANINEGKNGYAGSKGKSITSFYLCGERHYRVHYLNDDKYTWDVERWACDPTEVSRKIDAIAINGGKGYRVRLTNGKWLPMVYGFDINDSNKGYAGILGKEIDAILIEGGEYYRVAYGETPLNVEQSQNVLKNLFGFSYKLSYDKETEIINNSKIRVVAKLLHNWEINYDGLIKFNIVNNELKNANFGGKIDVDLNKMLQSDIDINVIDIKTTISKAYEKGMGNGYTTMTFHWLQSKVDIDSGTKINNEHSNFRQGFRITIYFLDDHDNLKKIKKSVNVFLKEIEMIIKSIIDSILSAFSSITQVPAIMDKHPNVVLQSFIILAIFLKPSLVLL